MLYMRSIPYGVNVRGIDDAARTYFHTTAADLNLSQSALLVAIVPHNPKAMPSLATLNQWRATALDRVRMRFPERYAGELSASYSTPVQAYTFPFLIAYKRGASERIPRDGWGFSGFPTLQRTHHVLFLVFRRS
jgi:membrane carboxypeptidase/penicillin-binding protein PbpC